MVKVWNGCLYSHDVVIMVCSNNGWTTFGMSGVCMSKDTSSDSVPITIWVPSVLILVSVS
jgi:hypothetical protein